MITSLRVAPSATSPRSTSPGNPFLPHGAEAPPTGKRLHGARKSSARIATIVKGLAIAVAMVLGSIAPAWADVCLQDSAGVLFVGKGFSIPGKGQCKAFNGYLAGSLIMVTGGACGTSNTDEVFITLTIGVGSWSNGSGASMDLSRSSLSGTIRYCTFEYECTNRSIAAIPCPASRPFGP